MRSADATPVGRRGERVGAERNAAVRRESATSSCRLRSGPLSCSLRPGLPALRNPTHDRVESKAPMIFTCPQCQSRVATPTQFDADIKVIECGICGSTLTAADHGQIVGDDRGTSLWQRLRGRFKSPPPENSA
jgi:ribosomal protein S27E